MGLQLFLNPEDVHSAKNIPTRVPGTDSPEAASPNTKVAASKSTSANTAANRWFTAGGAMFCFWIRAVSVGQQDIACCSFLPDRFGDSAVLATEIRGIAIALGAVTPLVSLCWPCIGEAIAGFLAHPNKHASTPSHNESAVAVIDRKPNGFIQTVGYQSFSKKIPETGHRYTSLEYGTKI